MVHKASVDNRTTTKTTNVADGSASTLERKENISKRWKCNDTTIDGRNICLCPNTLTGTKQGYPYTPFAQQYSCTAAPGVMDNFSGWFFRILIATATSGVINLAKHQRFAITSPRPLEIIHNHLNATSSYPMSYFLHIYFKIVHYKQIPDGLQQAH